MAGSGARDDGSPMTRGASAWRWTMAVATIVVSCLLVLSACGGSSSDATSGGTTDTTAASSGGEAGNPSEFVGKGKNGKLAKQGKEASTAEREAASKVLEENLEARAAGDWTGQCESLNVKIREGIVRVAPKGQAKSVALCATSLEGLAKNASKEILENPMTGPVAVFRIKGNQGFAFFHGSGGKDYVMPMEKEGSGWKVTSLVPQEAP